MLEKSKRIESPVTEGQGGIEMPYPSEHAARLKDPDLFIEGTMRSKSIADGVRLILGKLKKDGAGGSMTTQAVRFDKGKFTAEEAKKWLKDHDLSPISFEAASGGE